MAQPKNIYICFSGFLFWPVENASLVSIVSTLLLLCDDSDILTFSVNSQNLKRPKKKHGKAYNKM